MKLNNKGMTIVEILVTFAIVVVIVVSLYASISNLRSRQILSSYREEATKYKDLLTREIENDIITKQLIGALKTSDNSVTLKFRFGEDKVLSINKNSSDISLENATVCDTITQESSPDSISYGGVSYPLPDAGSDKLNVNGQCIRVYAMRILSVNNSTISVISDKFLRINIRIFHPELGDKYSIEIKTPIDYQ